ncbi:hypothetical protein ABTC74_19805, partial [Acinetobacter baumannii]
MRLSWTVFATALIAALLGAAAFAGIERVVPAAAGERARVEGVVHDYVLAHPEIIPEALDRLRD